MMSLRIVSSMAAIVLLGIAMTTPVPFVRAGGEAPDVIIGKGGSNYAFYRVNGCEREPFGVVNSFHKAPDEIKTQLGAMFAAGQRRLSIGIFHHHGPDSGTVMDSRGGKLSDQNRKNLENLLALVKEAGFLEISVVFHPMAPNEPSHWRSWSEDYYLENWGVIQDVRPIIIASGIRYKIVLSNEATPRAKDDDLLLRFAQRLWFDYTELYGKADTVGFSVIGGDPNRVASIPTVYGSNPPKVFDFHFYGAPGFPTDEYQQFIEADRQMVQMGYAQPWIVGEAFYDDVTAAAGLKRAVDESGRRVLHLYQWPKRRNGRCEHVDVAPASSFAAYAAQGF